MLNWRTGADALAIERPAERGEKARADRGRLILHVFPTFAFGGAQIRTIDLVHALFADDRHVIVSLNGEFGAADRLEKRIDWIARRIETRPSARPDLGNLGMFRRLLADCRPDLLLTYNWGAMEAALANRFRPLCPHVHFEDGFGPDEASGRQLPRRVWTRRLALSGRSVVVVPSATLHAIAAGAWKLSQKRLHYIPNGIDCGRFGEESGGTAGQGRDDGVIRIGTLGTLRREKNYGRLLRLFARLPDEPACRLVIVGDGPERSSLEELAERLGIAARVDFLGQMSRPEDLLRQLDIFALTSDTEQMPYCVIEAMAAGLPVVATDVGDLRIMLPAACRAFLAPPDSEDMLLAGLIRLIEAPELRSSLGRINRDHARRHFDRASMIERYRALFTAILDR